MPTSRSDVQATILTPPASALIRDNANFNLHLCQISFGLSITYIDPWTVGTPVPQTCFPSWTTNEAGGVLVAAAPAKWRVKGPRRKLGDI